MLKIAHIGILATDTYCMEMHDHDLWEAVLFSAGSGSIQLGDIILSFKTGDLFIIRPNLSHSVWSNEGFQNIFFTFPRCPLTNGSYFHLKDNANQVLYHLLCQMYEVYFQNDSYRENIINLSFDLFFQYVYSLSETPQINTYVEYIHNTIIHNLANPNFSLKEEIEKLHLNHNYVRDLFTQKVGCTPLQYLTEIRLDYAKQLLSSRNLTNYSIRNISFMCGFSDPYYFSRVFKKHTGVSPRNWESQTKHLTE